MGVGTRTGKFQGEVGVAGGGLLLPVRRSGTFHRFMDREDHIELSGLIRVQCSKIFCVATGSCLESAVAVN